MVQVAIRETIRWLLCCTAIVILSDFSKTEDWRVYDQSHAIKLSSLSGYPFIDFCIELYVRITPFCIFLQLLAVVVIRFWRTFPLFAFFLALLLLGMLCGD